MNERLTINYVSAWAADTIASADMHILCIALRYSKPKKPENHKSIYLLRFFNRTSASV